MKRLLSCILITSALICCLTACSFTGEVIGTWSDNLEANEKVVEMINALATNNTSDAKALMHPQVINTSNLAISQMSAYLSGRQADSVDLDTFSLNTSSGLSGKDKVRREQATYMVTLTDAEVIWVEVTYLSDDEGVGFTSFQLLLGLHGSEASD